MNNEFKEFMSLEDAVGFGTKYFGDWLKEFRDGGRWSGVYESRDMKYWMNEEEEGQEYVERIKHECSIYKTFSYYCGGNYGLAINELCRKGYSTFQFKIETIESMIGIMDNEIDKYDIKENIIAYRTLSYVDLLRAQKKDKLVKGDIIIDKGFMGVGLVREELLKGQHNYDTIIKVFAPVGCHAIYLDLISRRSDEQEVLLKRGTRLKVLSNSTSFFNNKRNMICTILI